MPRTGNAAHFSVGSRPLLLGIHLRFVLHLLSIRRSSVWDAIGTSLL
jgi:hypothetical protein